MTEKFRRKARGLMSKKIKYVLVLACVAAAFVGATIFFLLQSENEAIDRTTISINGETTKTLAADIKGLYPGGKSEYEIALDGGSDFEITLSFRDKSDGGLKEYIDVKITVGDKTIEKPLAELLDGGEISLGRNVGTIGIVYLMDEHAGNETQGADICFFIDITAKRGA